MSFAVAGEEVLAAGVALPVHLRRIWQERTTIGPAKALALSVLRQAAADLGKFGPARQMHRKLYLDAYAWVSSGDRRWPYSFLNLCNALQLSPESVRVELVGDAPSRRAGPFESLSGDGRFESPHSRGRRSGINRA